VFGIYTEKYPDQGFGYYWRARSNAAIDTSLKEGLAIPYYQKLVTMIADDTLTSTNKKWMLEAYSYLAAYETNTEKDYKEAIGYFDRILEIDPQNDNAKKYISILQQNLKFAVHRQECVWYHVVAGRWTCVRVQLIVQKGAALLYCAD
jgi:tetratricopeptide (TPR) repeat protein